MHTRELVELAAVVASHGRTLARNPDRLCSEGLNRYWSASRCRMDGWSYCLKRWVAEAHARSPSASSAQWPSIRNVLEEVLTSELLTRVWAAAVCAHDRLHDLDDGEPVVRSIFIGHQEVRCRVLNLLVQGPGIDVEHAMKLDHLRRRCDRWCDMLVGYLLASSDVSEFATDPARARDFAADLHDQAGSAGGRHAWSLVQVSLRAAFRHDLAPVSPHAEFNAQIAAAVLACIPQAAFDSTGILHTLWTARLLEATNDAQGLIEELLGTARCLPPGNDATTASEIWSGRARRFGN
jgi:hypothetical protein